MKIIAVDNFDRETVNDLLVCENVNSYYGTFIVDQLNEILSSDYAPRFYKLVENEYKLYEYEV